MIGIYCILHRDSGKRYIGKSVNINRRISAHKCHLTCNSPDAKSVNRYLHSAVQKYGWDAFDIEVLETIQERDDELLAERELYWMDHFNTTNSDFGFNLRRDSSSGMEVHAETRKLQAENAVRIHTGRKRSDETRANLSRALKGKLIGRKQSPEHVAARMASSKNKPRNYVMTDEHRRAISEANRKPKSEETRRKISEGKKGKKFSDEARRNMSKAQKARFAKGKQ